eukprot:CAMPEP_0182459934 /NCGR_PEP_ID=MMETSP1319-20130603/4947_1 /TAXON_ID=172717 /ORGANISM="Bolidomonas pacifica, Strain RCC208" /LENGTH=150 /DNA_ID=CAMNT_0024658953 /DNA_START=124 /DNA_END=573 /DNA_ORIENTATION=+
MGALASSIGDFQVPARKGALVLARIPFWLITYWLMLKIRRKAAQLPPAELSNFLCHTVLQGGASAMAPIIFFTFETVSCMASEDDLGNRQCDNTAYAASSLSMSLAIIAIASIASRTVPQEERGEGITYSNLAILRLKMKEKVQGVFGVI